MPLIQTTAELQMSDEDRKKLEAIALEGLLERRRRRKVVNHQRAGRR
jgi:hypothetical protein